jgi:hypothetical protein
VRFSSPSHALSQLAGGRRSIPTYGRRDGTTGLLLGSTIADLPVRFSRLDALARTILSGKGFARTSLQGTLWLSYRELE